MNVVGDPMDIRRETILHFAGYTVSAQCPSFLKVGRDFSERLHEWNCVIGIAYR